MPTAIYSSILTTVQTAIQALVTAGTLATFTNANIVIRKRPTEKALPDKPGILICPWGAVTTNHDAGTNERDDVEYPVLIAIVHNGGQDNVNNLSRNMLQCEVIRKEFIHQTLSGVTSVIDCRVDQRDTYDPSAWDDSVELAWLILRFVSRETRGN